MRAPFARSLARGAGAVRPAWRGGGCARHCHHDTAPPLCRLLSPRL